VKGTEIFIKVDETADVSGMKNCEITITSSPKYIGAQIMNALAVTARKKK